MPVHFLPPTRTSPNSNTTTLIPLLTTTTTITTTTTTTIPPPPPSNRFTPHTRHLILIIGLTIGTLITLLLLLSLIRFFHLSHLAKQKEIAWRKAEEMSRSSLTENGMDGGDPDWLLKRSGEDGGRGILFDGECGEGMGRGRRDSGVKEPEESYYFCPSKTLSWGSENSGTGLV